MNNFDSAVSEALNETLEPTSTELEDDEFELDEADEFREPEGESLKAFKARYIPFHLYVPTYNISRRSLHNWLYDSLLVKASTQLHLGWMSNLSCLPSLTSRKLIIGDTPQVQKLTRRQNVLPESLEGRLSLRVSRSITA